ncbi:MAG: hypothetical protein ACJ77K_13590 [Bacteroidia bacterium]
MKRSFLILFSLGLFACSQSQKPVEAADTKSQISLEEQPARTVIEMIEWYAKHQDVRGCLVLNSCSDIWDSTKYYAVNFEATEMYLNSLKESGFFSEKYVENWRTYFKKANNDFKKDPQNDGPPEGFDYDFIMQGQDYETELENPRKATVKECTGDEHHKIVTLDFHTGCVMNYELSNIDGKWKIDRIGA